MQNLNRNGLRKSIRDYVPGQYARPEHAEKMQQAFPTVRVAVIGPDSSGKSSFTAATLGGMHRSNDASDVGIGNKFGKGTIMTQAYPLTKDGSQLLVDTPSVEEEVWDALHAGDLYTVNEEAKKADADSDAGVIRHIRLGFSNSLSCVCAGRAPDGTLLSFSQMGPVDMLGEDCEWEDPSKTFACAGMIVVVTMKHLGKALYVVKKNDQYELPHFDGTEDSGLVPDFLEAVSALVEHVDGVVRCECQIVITGEDQIQKYCGSDDGEELADSLERVTAFKTMVAEELGRNRVTFMDLRDPTSKEQQRRALQVYRRSLRCADRGMAARALHSSLVHITATPEFTREHRLPEPGAEALAGAGAAAGGPASPAPAPLMIAPAAEAADGPASFAAVVAADAEAPAAEAAADAPAAAPAAVPAADAAADDAAAAGEDE